MKAKRKAERDHAKRDASRNRTRSSSCDAEASDAPADDLDLQIIRSLQGYDE